MVFVSKLDLYTTVALSVACQIPLQTSRYCPTYAEDHGPLKEHCAQNLIQLVSLLSEAQEFRGSVNFLCGPRSIEAPFGAPLAMCVNSVPSHSCGLSSKIQMTSPASQHPLAKLNLLGQSCTITIRPTKWKYNTFSTHALPYVSRSLGHRETACAVVAHYRNCSYCTDCDRSTPFGIQLVMKGDRTFWQLPCLHAIIP